MAEEGSTAQRIGKKTAHLGSNLQLTSYNLQLATYSLQLTTCNLQLTTYNFQLSAFNIQLSTFNFTLSTLANFCLGQFILRPILLRPSSTQVNLFFDLGVLFWSPTLGIQLCVCVCVCVFVGVCGPCTPFPWTPLSRTRLRQTTQRGPNAHIERSMALNRDHNSTI